MTTDPNLEFPPELLLADDEAAAFAAVLFDAPAKTGSDEGTGADTGMLVDLTDDGPILDVRDESLRAKGLAEPAQYESEPPPDGAEPMSPPLRREGDSLFPSRVQAKAAPSSRAGGTLFANAKPKKLERTVPKGGLFETSGLSEPPPVTVEIEPIGNESKRRSAPWVMAGLGTLVAIGIMLLVRSGQTGAETEAVGPDVSLIPATVVTSIQPTTIPPASQAPTTTRAETTVPTTEATTSEPPEAASTTLAPAVTQAPTTKRPRPPTTSKPRPASTAPAATPAPTTAVPQTLPPEVTVEGLAPPTWQATTTPPPTTAPPAPTPTTAEG